MGEVTLDWLNSPEREAASHKALAAAREWRGDLRSCVWHLGDGTVLAIGPEAMLGTDFLQSEN